MKHSESAPATSIIGEDNSRTFWPGPGDIDNEKWNGYAQQESKFDNTDYSVTMETTPRKSGTPTSSVIGATNSKTYWPFPQFNQKKTFTMGPSDNWGVEATFPRSSTAPKSAEVANWPFPQWNQANSTIKANSTVAQSAPALAQAAPVMAQDPSPTYGIQERFGRPADAPTKPEVDNWPTQKELGWPSLTQAEKQEKDIAANKYMNNEVHKMASKYVEPEGLEWNRRAKAPTTAEVANWPLQYAQHGQADADIARNEHVNPDTFHLANPHVPAKAEIPRQAEAPKSAEVGNWPFPQYA